MLLKINKLVRLGKIGNNFQLKVFPHNTPIIIYIYYIFIKLVSWVMSGYIFSKRIEIDKFGKMVPTYPTFQLGSFFALKSLIYNVILSWKIFQLKSNLIPTSNF